MTAVFTGIIAFSILAGAAVFIWVMIDVKRVIQDVKRILETAESGLELKMEDLNEDLKLMKTVLEDMNQVSDNVKVATAAARKIGENVEEITTDVKDTVALMKGVPSLASSQFAAVKAGIRTGVVVFLKNLFWGVKPEKGKEHKREEV